MKHLFIGTIAALLIGGTTLTACNDDKEEEIGGATFETLSASVEKLDFLAKAETKTFTIKTKDEWKIETPRYATWFTVEPRSGKGNTEVKVSVFDLPEEAEVYNESYINISTATNSINVFVSQRSAVK